MATPAHSAELQLQGKRTGRHVTPEGFAPIVTPAVL